MVAVERILRVFFVGIEIKLLIELVFQKLLSKKDLFLCMHTYIDWDWVNRLIDPPTLVPDLYMAFVVLGWVLMLVAQLGPCLCSNALLCHRHIRGVMAKWLRYIFDSKVN